MSNPRAYFTLKEPGKARVTFNDVTVYEGDVPGGEEVEFLLNGKIPRESGEARLFINEKHMGSWTFTYADPVDLLSESQPLLDRAKEHQEKKRFKLAYRLYGQAIDILEQCSDSGRSSDFKGHLCAAYEDRSYSAYGLSYRNDDMDWLAKALECTAAEIALREQLFDFDESEESFKGNVGIIFHHNNHAVELNRHGDFAATIEAANKGIAVHKRLAVVGDSRMELRLTVLVAEAQVSLGLRDDALKTIDTACSAYHPEASEDSVKLEDFAALCVIKAKLVEKRVPATSASG